MLSSESADSLEMHQAPQEVVSVFKKLGGYTALDLAVKLFYKKVLDDPLLQPYFTGIPMETLQRKQVAFMTYAFGGSNEYFGRKVLHAHRRMIQDRGLNTVHFDAVAGHFVATLKELGVDDTVIQEAAQTILATRDLFDPKALKDGKPITEAQHIEQLHKRLMHLQAEREKQKAAAAAAAGVAACPHAAAARTGHLCPSANFQGGCPFSAAAAPVPAAANTGVAGQSVAAPDTSSSNKTRIKLSVLARAIAPALEAELGTSNSCVPEADSAQKLGQAPAVQQPNMLEPRHNSGAASGTSSRNTTSSTATGAEPASKLNKKTKLALLQQLGILKKPSPQQELDSPGSTIPTAQDVPQHTHVAPSTAGSAHPTTVPTRPSIMAVAADQQSHLATPFSPSSRRSSSSGESLIDSDEEAEEKRNRQSLNLGAVPPSPNKSLQQATLSTVMEASESESSVQQWRRSAAAASNSSSHAPHSGVCAHVSAAGCRASLDEEAENWLLDSSTQQRSKSKSWFPELLEEVEKSLSTKWGPVDTDIDPSIATESF